MDLIHRYLEQLVPSGSGMHVEQSGCTLPYFACISASIASSSVRVRTGVDVAGSGKVDGIGLAGNGNMVGIVEYRTIQPFNMITVTKASAVNTCRLIVFSLIR